MFENLNYDTKEDKKDIEQKDTDEQKENDTQIENNDKNIKQLVKNITDKIDPENEELKNKINDLIKKHNHEKALIDSLTQLDHEFWEKININDIKTNLIFVNQNFDWENVATQEYTQEAYLNIINKLKWNDITILWNTNTQIINSNIENEKESFLETEYCIPTKIDKENYDKVNITTFDTIYWHKENWEACTMLEIHKQINERKKSKIFTYEKSNIGTVQENEKDNYKSYSILQWYTQISDLKIEQTDKKWTNWEQLYKITFNIYTPKEKNGQ